MKTRVGKNNRKGHKEIYTTSGEVLSYIKEFKVRWGFTPTLREIQKRFGYKDSSGAQHHVEALFDSGLLIRLARKKGRNIGIPFDSRESLETDYRNNVAREETIYWIKHLPWWRRLFNKFEV